MRKKAARSQTVSLSVGSGSSSGSSVEARSGAPARPPETLAQGLLILVELAAEWPELSVNEPTPRRVLSQLEGESPAQFAARVAGQLDSLFGRGIALGTVALACNERLDAAAETARRKLCGLALGAMAKQKNGKVCLTASERSSARLRQGLTTLSQGLFEEWRTAGLEVKVVVGPEHAPAPASQVFAYTARVA
jgi:hypothetical protein